MLNQVAYHKEEPGVDDNPIYARSNTLLPHKRALSYYMPRKDEKRDWNAEGGGKGNPTTSKNLTKLVERVDLSVSNRQNFKKRRKMINSVQKRVERVVLYNTRSVNVSSDSPAVMYDCKSLHEYYIEHEFGIGGNKATKRFTKAEKRKNKDKICLIKKVSQCCKISFASHASD